MTCLQAVNRGNASALGRGRGPGLGAGAGTSVPGRLGQEKAEKRLQLSGDGLSPCVTEKGAGKQNKKERGSPDEHFLWIRHAGGTVIIPSPQKRTPRVTESHS